jgi:hypothetical protein
MAPVTDTEPIEPEETEDAIPPAKFDTWRRRSAVGAVATGIALGLKDVFYPTNNEPVITAEAPGDPPDADRGIRVVLDPDDPTKSRVIFPSPTDDPPPPSADS